MFQGELTPICLLPVNKMTLPPSDTVGAAAPTTAASPAQAAALGLMAKLCLGVYVPGVLRLFKSQYQTFI